MNVYLNYLLEANLGLCVFLLIYSVVLGNETDFTRKRLFLLAGIISSIIFPLIHLKAAPTLLPTLGDLLPSKWLPEFVVTATGASAKEDTTLDLWMAIKYIYNSGLIIMLMVFFTRLFTLLKTVYQSTKVKYGRFIIVETVQNKSAFSFFRFIFIGQSDQLSTEEKQQIIYHEQIHADRMHSLDILLLNVLSIFFWFNPAIKFYKKIFVQLHEFEADARAVEKHDVNNYCSLLAKVALLSADFTLANHFSNSLTVKRINMMRSNKNKIKAWKLATLVAVLPMMFFLLACQDQLLTEVQDLARTSSVALDIPADVQLKIDELQATKPDQKFIVIETTTAEGKATLDKIESNKVASVHVFKPTPAPSEQPRSFVVIEYNENVRQMADAVKGDDEVYMVVEENASFVGGVEGLGRFLGSNIQYPADAQKAGTEGAVFVSMIINKDGSLSDITIVKGVDPLLDAEALRVVKLSPNWIPGKQNGNLIRQRFVLPVKFKLG